MSQTADKFNQIIGESSRNRPKAAMEAVERRSSRFCCASSAMRAPKKRERVGAVMNWPIVYCCAVSLVAMILSSTNQPASVQCQEVQVTGASTAIERTKIALTPSRPNAAEDLGFASDDDEQAQNEARLTLGDDKPGSAVFVAVQEQPAQRKRENSRRSKRSLASPLVPSLALLMPINELRVSGSKNEPPSRPSVDWSKQRPYFGNLDHNVSVELGRTAKLTCKVFELGDKTVSWLRPRENEILTAGRYTYIGDTRFTPINDDGSPDWILEIKDVGLNDSTTYECQVSTDPKMSAIINLQVKAVKARIKQGEQFYAPLGSNIEFACEIGQKSSIYSTASPPAASVQQTYWYFNGNLLNYARIHAVDKNFSIDWDPMTQTSRFKLFNVQSSDAGNYTCKPTSAEPSTIRLHVKRFNKNGQKDRAHYNNGYHSATTKEAQRNRHYGLDSGSNGLELMDSSGANRLKSTEVWAAALMISGLLALLYNHYLPQH